jgi:hypothetical protein
MALDRGGPYRERPVHAHEAPRVNGHDALVVVALVLALASIEHWSDVINGFSAAMGFPRVR